MIQIRSRDLYYSIFLIKRDINISDIVSFICFTCRKYCFELSLTLKIFKNSIEIGSFWQSLGSDSRHFLSDFELCPELLEDTQKCPQWSGR